MNFALLAAPATLRDSAVTCMSSSKKSVSVRQYALIVLASALLAIGLAEAYLAYRAPSRLVLPFYNELHPYVMFRPHASATYVTPDTLAMSHYQSKVCHYTNEDGFRVSAPDYELPRAKPAGQLRVAFLGSSAVQLGSTYETTLPGSLKRLLQEKHPGRDVEVINAGIQSCVSRQSIAHFLFTVRDYQPDVVILYDGVNDIGLPLTYESRANYPYNFQTMQEAWDAYRQESQVPVLSLLLNRSRLYAALRVQWEDEAAKTVSNVALGLNKAPNAVSADHVLSHPEFARKHIAAYLSNWERLLELSKTYGFETICVLQPTGGLDRDYAVPLTVRDFNLTEEGALDWIAAFTVLYEEADRQAEALARRHPERTFLNLRSSLHPAKDHFWDLVHVYDETNDHLAELIYGEADQVFDRAAANTN